MLRTPSSGGIVENCFVNGVSHGGTFVVSEATTIGGGDNPMAT
jgi:hypothetical protein